MELINVCEFIVDCPHTTAKDEGVGYPLVRTPNVGKGRLILNGVHRVSEEIYKQRISRAIPSEGDLILAREAPVGNVAIITEGIKVCLGQRVVLIRPNRKVAYPSYLVYYLLSPKVQHSLTNAANGAVVSHLNVADIRKLEVELPEMELQQKIGNILSSLDTKIETNNKINSQLEEMAQAIFKSWFVDFEPFKGQKMVESELGLIPEGWKVGTLSDITTNITTKVGTREDVKVLSPVTSGELVLSEEYFTKQVYSASIAKYKVVNRGHFAYNPARVNIGSIGRNEFDFDGCVSPVYVVFAVNEGYENYVDLLRKSNKFKTAVVSRAIGGVRQSLSYDDFGMIEAIIPTRDAVEKFNLAYDQIKKTIQQNNQESLRLSQLRDTLLPKLMSSEIEI